jgi:hypothetical protein
MHTVLKENSMHTFNTRKRANLLGFAIISVLVLTAVISLAARSPE